MIFQLHRATWPGILAHAKTREHNVPNQSPPVMPKQAMIIIPPRGQIPLFSLDKAPPLDKLQKAVGGYIEAVPYFNHLEYYGNWYDCIAFCNEEGKNQNLEINPLATMSWFLSMNRQFPNQIKKVKDLNDVLVGSVCIIVGPKKFLDNL